jgi:hypothetical protein
MEEIEPVYGCGNCPYSDVGYWDGVSGQWGIDCFYGAKDNMTPRRAYTKILATLN